MVLYPIQGTAVLFFMRGNRVGLSLLFIYPVRVLTSKYIFRLYWDNYWCAITLCMTDSGSTPRISSPTPFL